MKAFISVVIALLIFSVNAHADVVFTDGDALIENPSCDLYTDLYPINKKWTKELAKKGYILKGAEEPEPLSSTDILYGLSRGIKIVSTSVRIETVNGKSTTTIDYSLQKDVGNTWFDTWVAQLSGKNSKKFTDELYEALPNCVVVSDEISEEEEI